MQKESVVLRSIRLVGITMVAFTVIDLFIMTMWAAMIDAVLAILLFKSPAKGTLIGGIVFEALLLVGIAGVWLANRVGMYPLSYDTVNFLQLNLLFTVIKIALLAYAFSTARKA
jgi:hypothetical protein